MCGSSVCFEIQLTISQLLGVYFNLFQNFYFNEYNLFSLLKNKNLSIYLFIYLLPKYSKLQFLFTLHSLYYKSNPAEENIFLFARPAYLKTNLKLVLI